MTRNLLIMAIEKRINILLNIKNKYKGMTDEGLPMHENIAAEYELVILKHTSKKLQELGEINPWNFTSFISFIDGIILDLTKVTEFVVYAENLNLKFGQIQGFYPSGLT